MTGAAGITVLKLGGSLAAAPGRLRALLGAIADGAHGACAVVPGGGAHADAVREAQMREGFDDAEAHRRALGAMGRTARLLRDIEPRLGISVAPWFDASPPPKLRGGRALAEARARPASRIWDPAALRPGHPDIPESWDVTSDSLALWLAARLRARRCVVVKLADAPPGSDSARLAGLGLVDTAFPAFAARFTGRIEVWGPSGAVAVAPRVAA